MQLVKLMAMAALLFVSVAGCEGDSEAVDAATSIDAAGAVDAAAPDGAASAACYPEGIYGICADLGCPNCLNGAGFYAVCTASCQTNEECGDPADFNGAMPFCAELNPGAAQHICVLICTAQEQCPCGLECRPSGAGPMICAKTL